MTHTIVDPQGTGVWGNTPLIMWIIMFIHSYVFIHTLLHFPSPSSLLSSTLLPFLLLTLLFPLHHSLLPSLLPVISPSFLSFPSSSFLPPSSITALRPSLPPSLSLSQLSASLCVYCTLSPISSTHTYRMVLQNSLWPLIMVIWRYVVQFLIAKGANVNIRRKV